MAASIYVTGLASDLVRMRRRVLFVDPEKGRLAFHSNEGCRITIHARWVRGRLKITETKTF